MTTPLRQSKVTGALALTVAQAVVLFLGYIVHPWIGRILGPAQYGVFGVVISVQAIFGMLMTLGVPSAVSKFVAQNQDHAQAILRRALKIQVVTGIIISCIFAGISPIISYFLNDKLLIPYLIFASIIIFLQGLYPIYVQFLSGMHRFMKQAALTSVYAVAKLVGAISLLYVFQLYGALAGFATGGIVAALLGWYWTRSMGGRQAYTIHLQSFLSFAGTYAIILVGLQILMSQDLFMVKALLRDNIQAGYYNAAVNISRISYMLLQGISFVLLPSVAALTKPGASHDTAAAFIKDALRYLIAIIVPSIALASATSRELITLFFSREYVAAAPVLTVLMIGLGCLSFYLLLTNIVAGAGKARVALYITAGMIVVSALLGYNLIPRMQLIGAAWQTTIAAALGLLVLAIYTFRVFQIPYPLASTFRIVIATILAVLPTYFWKVGSFMLPVQYILLGCIYLGALYLLGEIREKDMKLITSFKKAS